MAESTFSAAKNTAEKSAMMAIDIGRGAAGAAGDAVSATTTLAIKAGNSISDSAEKSFVAVKAGAGTIGDSSVAGARAIGTVLGSAADTAGDALAAVGVLVGDLNGDGKVDFEDAKIAAAKMKEVAAATALELGQLGKSALQSKLAQDAAAGALVGGALASMIPIPFISTLTGATAGAALGAYNSFGKK